MWYFLYHLGTYPQKFHWFHILPQWSPSASQPPLFSVFLWEIFPWISPSHHGSSYRFPVDFLWISQSWPWTHSAQPPWRALHGRPAGDVVIPMEISWWFWDHFGISNISIQYWGFLFWYHFGAIIQHWWFWYIILIFINDEFWFSMQFWDHIPIQFHSIHIVHQYNTGTWILIWYRHYSDTISFTLIWSDRMAIPHEITTQYVSEYALRMIGSFCEIMCESQSQLEFCLKLPYGGWWESHCFKEVPVPRQQHIFHMVDQVTITLVLNPTYTIEKPSKHGDTLVLKPTFPIKQ